MLPAKPPLPVPLKRSFQPDWGIQISTRMSESGLGFNVAVTRQKAGRSGKGFPVVGTNLPAGTTSALVMVVCGNCRAARPSQLARAGTWKRASIARTRRRRRVGLGVNKRECTRKGFALQLGSGVDEILSQIKEREKRDKRDKGPGAKGKGHVERCGIPLKPKNGLNGAPSLCCLRRRERPGAVSLKIDGGAFLR
jgi:hypothetical protein